jgi:hypothetical protein
MIESKGSLGNPTNSVVELFLENKIIKCSLCQLDHIDTIIASRKN